MKLVVLLMVICMSLAGFSQEASSVRTFKEWKSEKVQEALQKVVDMKTKYSALQRQGAVSKDLLSKLSQAEFNLEVSRELTISDYFDIYLKSQANYEAAVTEISSKLSSAEVAEMLLHFNKSNKAQLSLETSEVKVAEEGKLAN